MGDGGCGGGKGSSNFVASWNTFASSSGKEKIVRNKVFMDNTCGTYVKYFVG